ncbi:MAG: FKBP-type peptidyl-prolyl cis-trans isomerase [Actinomycetota bacterium]|nr:FKBP-type peptidyl-prolyl cis-trans isomerase [Actinomycetota bacterium]
MTNRSLAIPVLAASALALAGCGTSKAPGIQAAPSAGATAAPATPTTTTPTATTTTPTTTTPKPTVPLPAALKTRPTVAIPSRPPPKKLVIKDLIKGTGPAATPTSTVTVQYVGKLYKGGKQFDASWSDGTGQPVTFPLSGVIAGWTQGIPGMKEGGRRELIIPPSLAYKNVARPGSGAAHAAIPPNSTLVFVIDLHAVS